MSAKASLMQSTAAAEPRPRAPRCAVNYHHWGEPKRWYGVPAGAAAAFEAAFREELPEQFERHPDLLFHLVAMLSPAALRRRGVPVYGVLQARAAPQPPSTARRRAPSARAARRQPIAASPRRVRVLAVASALLQPAARAARVCRRLCCVRLQRPFKYPVDAPAPRLGAARPRRGHARGRRALVQGPSPVQAAFFPLDGPRQGSLCLLDESFPPARRRRRASLW